MIINMLDLFCNAGAGAIGYWQASNEHEYALNITGVDIVKQPRYPFKYIVDDAIKYFHENAKLYDCFHASPPCQGYSCTWHMHKKLYPDLVSEIRKMFIASGKPWIIENVEGAPLINPIKLTGKMFNLNLKRNRLFESNFFIPMPGLNKQKPITTFAGSLNIGIKKANQIFGTNGIALHEITQGIPPAYTKHIGYYLLNQIKFNNENKLLSCHS